MEDWYCKPNTEAEAKEIVERAVANGVVSDEVVRGGSLSGDDYPWDLCSHWGVVDGETYTGDAEDTDDAFYNKTELTLEQVREMFPLESDKKPECADNLPPQWITITNPADIKKVPVGTKIRINGDDKVLTAHYDGWDNGFDTEKGVDGVSYTFSHDMWDRGYTVEYLLEAHVEHTESDLGETDTTPPVSEENDVEASEIGQDLVKKPNHYMLFPEHSLEVKHITKRVLDRIDVSDMDLSLNQAGWLQQALQYLLRCYAKGGKQDIEKAKEALEILLSEEK